MTQSKSLPALAPRTVFGTEERFLEKNTLGAVGMNYNPETFNKQTGSSRSDVNNTVRFGTSERFSSKDLTDPVGPGRYAPTPSSKAKMGSFGKESRFSFKRSNTATPDLCFNPDSFSASANGKMDPNRAGQSFGKGQRFGNEGEGGAPGPQYYTALVSGKLMSVGKSKRFRAEPGSANQTGPNFMPGSMHTTQSQASKFDKQDRWATGNKVITEHAALFGPGSTISPKGAPKFGRSARFGDNRAPTTVGGLDFNPATFNNINGTNRANVNPTVRFSKTERFPTNETGRVGAEYNPSSFNSLANGKVERTASGAFNKAQRWAGRGKNTTPGPTYNPPILGRSPGNVKIGTQRRFSSGKTSTPGPNYAPPGIDSQSSFVKWHRPREAKKKESSGPGFVMPPNPRAKSAATFGTAPRFNSASATILQAFVPDNAVDPNDGKNHLY